MFPVILVEFHALSYLLDNAPNQTPLCFCVYFGCFYRLWQTAWGYLTSLCSSSSSFNVYIVNRPPAASGVCLWAAETCCFWTMSSSNLAGQIFAQFLSEKTLISLHRLTTVVETFPVDSPQDVKWEKAAVWNQTVPPWHSLGNIWTLGQTLFLFHWWLSLYS